MLHAIRGVELEVLQWVIPRRPDDDMVDLLHDAAVYGNFDVVWFLHRNFRECGSIETLKKKLFGLYRQMEFAEWAYAHHRHEFERDIAGHLFD
ncbi:hypothetical protein P3T76_003337 [Phytophthora citrophthora]|uniref:Uncharacterized protein n=1 Tax=Phytophthora citrophthora TaxID=4793 RepID=A0AAD9GTF8_9STRA|nr:hypothetical protein P3T76_003337 [Phytophthora citrophthora]